MSFSLSGQFCIIPITTVPRSVKRRELDDDAALDFFGQRALDYAIRVDRYYAPA